MVDSKQVLPYGSWPSTIGAEDVAASGVHFAEVNASSQRLIWSELRPQEGGRYALCTLDDQGQKQDCLPAEYAAHSRVHEYGGGALAYHEDWLFFVNHHDQQVYGQRAGEAPRRLTPGDERRYGDLIVDGDRQRLLAVCEDHRGSGEPSNSLVALTWSTDDAPQTLFDGTDFVGGLALDTGGQRLAWLTWNHPDMPWDTTTLWTAVLTADGQLTEPQYVAGGEAESILEPRWHEAGGLYFFTDCGGYWNLWTWDGESKRPVFQEPVDYGGPMWMLAPHLWTLLDEKRAVVQAWRDGFGQLVIVDLASGRLSPLDLPAVAFGQLQPWGKAVVAIAKFADALPSLVAIDVDTASMRSLVTPNEIGLEKRAISRAESVWYDTHDNERCHAFYYAPTNPTCSGPANEAPPLIVISHGGPTSSATPSFSMTTQYWTSRGFAVLDVNYRGSDGFGRAYRKSLDGRWGVLDVTDCLDGAQAMANQGKADGARLLMRGGSSGGYSVLCALTYHDVLAAGACYYGICDLAALARDTHKFESRYLFSLLVPPDQQSDAVFHERSPLFHIDGLDKPLIVFQGLKDRVVPPNQSETIVAALQRKQVPVAYLAFEDEFHGFRNGVNIVRSLQAELSFYRQILEIEAAENLPDIPIHNLS